MSDTSHKTFQPGEVIFREGEPGDVAYIIESGLVRVSALREGRNVELATLSDGELLGEMALLDNGTRTATVTSLGETVLIPISAEVFERKLEASDPLVHVLLTNINSRFRRTLAGMLAGEQNKPPTKTENQPDKHADQLRQQAAVDSLKLENDMRKGLEAGEFSLYYQPIISLADLSITGFEALARWQHPGRGLLLPASFIPVAETSGLIMPLGEQLLEQACKDLKWLQDEVKRPYKMHLNLSGKQLDSSLVNKLNWLLVNNGVYASNFNLEITESQLMAQPELAQAVLHDLRKLGVRIVLDDFGTGYSSLGYLSRFRVDTIKIDGAFIAAMRGSQSSLAVVRAIMGLAGGLNVDVVAEGIEHVADAKLLTAMKCQRGQGFLFSEAVQRHQLIDFITVYNQRLHRGLDMKNSAFHQLDAEHL